MLKVIFVRVTLAAIMCAAAPEVAAFMADEAVLSVPDLGKLDYTQKHYLAYASKIQDKAKQLTTLGTITTIIIILLIL